MHPWIKVPAIAVVVNLMTKMSKITFFGGNPARKFDTFGKNNMGLMLGTGPQAIQDENLNSSKKVKGSWLQFLHIGDICNLSYPIAQTLSQAPVLHRNRSDIKTAQSKCSFHHSGGKLRDSSASYLRRLEYVWKSLFYSIDTLPRAVHGQLTESGIGADVRNASDMVGMGMRDKHRFDMRNMPLECLLPEIGGYIHQNREIIVFDQNRAAAAPVFWIIMGGCTYTLGAVGVSAHHAIYRRHTVGGPGAKESDFHKMNSFQEVSSLVDAGIQHQIYLFDEGYLNRAYMHITSRLSCDHKGKYTGVETLNTTLDLFISQLIFLSLPNGDSFHAHR